MSLAEWKTAAGGTPVHHDAYSENFSKGETVPNSHKDRPWWGTKPHQNKKTVALTEKPSQQWKHIFREKLAKFSSKITYNSTIIAATEKSSLR